MKLWFKHSTNAQCNHRTSEKCEATKFLLLKSTKAFTEYRIVQHADWSVLNSDLPAEFVESNYLKITYDREKGLHLLDGQEHDD